MNYEKEMERIETAEANRKDWFRPEEGVYAITFLEEPGELVERTFKVDGGDKKVMQSDVLIEVNKERKAWTLTQAKTKNSLWGQLVYLGRSWGGLTGKSVNLIVKGQNRDKDYTVTEFVHLRDKEKQRQETL